MKLMEDFLYDEVNTERAVRLVALAGWENELCHSAFNCTLKLLLQLPVPRVQRV